MLSGKKISGLLKKGEEEPGNGLGCCPNPLNFDESQIGPASLDIRLGSWLLTLQQTKRTVINLAHKENKGIEFIDGEYHYTPAGEVFVVHPGRFVLGSTLEWLRFPPDLGGLITGKSSLGRRGLIIETAAGIQPNFSGCLTLEIYNCGEVPIAITPGMRIAQIFFHEISGEVQNTPSKFSGRRKPIFGTYNLDTKLEKVSTETLI